MQICPEVARNGMDRSKWRERELLVVIKKKVEPSFVSAEHVDATFPF